MATLREAMVGAGVACRKFRFWTRAEAATAVEGLVTSGRDTDPSRPFNIWRCPRCGGWHIGHGWRRDVTVRELEEWHRLREEATGVTTQHEQLREAVAALPAGKRVLVMGGKAGVFASWVHRHPAVEHVESTESGGRWESTYAVPARAGVVVVTKFLAVTLSREVMRQCKVQGVPVFGVYNSPGAVNRALAFAFDVDKATAAAALEPAEEAGVAAVAAIAAVTRPERVALMDPDPVQPPDEAEVVRVFAEAAAALDLARDTALAALRGARQASEDAGKLRALRALLKEAGVD